ncbi:MAG: serine/threonine protein kinase, partial [Deltaproteobacteria bacterium]|nr:serine/threonine protein kinase [Deltaproteobacteria bacterium]
MTIKTEIDSKNDLVVGANDLPLQKGEVVGEYVIQSKLGSGGFGSVFKAEHPVIGKLVAIKVLHRKYSGDPEIVSRFVAEARAVNQIRHRNIIDIFGFGQLEDGRQYYVMEYLAGLTLDEYLAAKGQLEAGDAIAILRGIAKALDAAHRKGIAHRDLKPDNIMLAEQEGQSLQPKLLDFGIAKLL